MTEERIISPEILIDEIKKKRNGDPNSILVLCQDLFDLSEKCDHPYAKAFSFVYFSYSYIKLFQLKSSIDYGQKAHHLLLEYDFIDLLPLLDNILGCAFTYKGDFQSGMNYYFEGIHLLNQHNDAYLLSAIYSNTAFLYYLSGDYRHALEYALQSQNSFISAKENINNILLCEMQMKMDFLKIYFALDKPEQVAQFRKECQDLLNNNTDPEYIAAFGALCAQIDYSGKKDPCAIFSTLQDVFSTLEESVHTPFSSKTSQTANYHLDYISLFWSYHRACSVLLSIMKEQTFALANYSSYDELVTFFISRLDLFYQISLKLNQPYLWMYYNEIKIQLYEYLLAHSTNAIFKNTYKIQLLTSYQHYYEQTLLRVEENKTEQLSRLKDTISLRNAKKQNKAYRLRAVKLKMESEQDALTGCANRYGLNSFMLNYFNYTKEIKQSFCCMILDVDFFKQYNDFYGHLAGDHCLKRICEMIRDSQNDEGFLVRYGGDEFVLLFIGKKDEEILSIAQNIKTNIENEKIPHEKSTVSPYVTITMGIVNRIPDLYSHADDFLHAADVALYKVKLQSKNNYLLVHDL